MLNENSFSGLSSPEKTNAEKIARAKEEITAVQVEELRKKSKNIETRPNLLILTSDQITIIEAELWDNFTAIHDENSYDDFIEKQQSYLNSATEQTKRFRDEFNNFIAPLAMAKYGKILKELPKEPIK